VFRSGMIIILLSLFLTSCMGETKQDLTYAPLATTTYSGGIEKPRCAEGGTFTEMPPTWRDCSYSISYKGSPVSFWTYGFLNSEGKGHGKRLTGWEKHGELFKRCTVFVEDGKLQGWEICEGIAEAGEEPPVISKKFYVNGILSPNKVAYRAECEEIGFTPKTEKFGECILRLMELEVTSTRNRVISNDSSGTTDAVRSLKDEIKRQNDITNATELLDRSLKMMELPSD